MKVAVIGDLEGGVERLWCRMGTVRLMNTFQSGSDRLFTHTVPDAFFGIATDSSDGRSWFTVIEMMRCDRQNR